MRFLLVQSQRVAFGVAFVAEVAVVLLDPRMDMHVLSDLELFEESFSANLRKYIFTDFLKRPTLDLPHKHDFASSGGSACDSDRISCLDIPWRRSRRAWVRCRRS